VSENSPTWSYGESKLIKSSGMTVDSGDISWSYGKSIINHEYVFDSALLDQAPRDQVIFKSPLYTQLKERSKLGIEMDFESPICSELRDKSKLQ